MNKDDAIKTIEEFIASMRNKDKQLDDKSTVIEQEFYDRGYQDGRGWRDKYSWHYEPENGWDENTIPEFGELVLFARPVYSSYNNQLLRVDYQTGYLNENFECESGYDFFLFDMEEVAAWSKIQFIEAKEYISD